MMVVTTEGIEDIPGARKIPTPGLAAYRRFWRAVKRSSDERDIDIPAPLRNAIRNAWRDGYWTGRKT